jgi:YHS domain-containing protein
MELIQSIFWILALWWLLSNVVTAIKVIQIQKAIEKNNELNRNQPKNIELDTKADDPAEVEMVEDKVCGKVIEKSRAYQLFHEGKLFYFCSWDCRQTYIQEYIKQSE